MSITALLIALCKSTTSDAKKEFQQLFCAEKAWKTLHQGKIVKHKQNRITAMCICCCYFVVLLLTYFGLAKRYLQYYFSKQYFIMLIAAHYCPRPLIIPPHFTQAVRLSISCTVFVFIVDIIIFPLVSKKVEFVSTNEVKFLIFGSSIEFGNF